MSKQTSFCRQVTESQTWLACTYLYMHNHLLTIRCPNVQRWGWESRKPKLWGCQWIDHTMRGAWRDNTGWCHSQLQVYGSCGSMKLKGHRLYDMVQPSPDQEYSPPRPGFQFDLVLRNSHCQGSRYLSLQRATHHITSHHRNTTTKRKCIQKTQFGHCTGWWPCAFYMQNSFLVTYRFLPPWNFRPRLVGAVLHGIVTQKTKQFRTHFQ